MNDMILEWSRVKPVIVESLPSNKQEYYSAAGNPIVGTTTITGRLPKYGLTKWSNDLGIRGEDSNANMVMSGNVGTVAHEKIDCFNRGVVYVRRQEWEDHEHIKGYEKMAEICFQKYMDFLKDYPSFKILWTEKVLISEEYQYGGMLDMGANFLGKTHLFDLKTGNSIHTDHKIQVMGAYKTLADEHGLGIEKAAILHCNRDPDQPYKLVVLRNQYRWFGQFKALLMSYQWEREMIARHKTEEDKAEKKENKLFYKVERK